MRILQYCTELLRTRTPFRPKVINIYYILLLFLLNVSYNHLDGQSAAEISTPRHDGTP